ncbi:type I restriction-modification system HsdS subunit protein [Rhizobium etli 8C-3]|uniref:Type I restriction-modification system HsdS subunit protein n=1 Tax=Rhizobium etli 8C-3 TaxID=538025 RepID=A0A1L5P532_RHIET|nr:restriction endonuclease subunit S [Rhizobium etli]APO75239.1 type I restriction-modification system HsdS subunit protein [Rhizobium etli 8C-3]
MTLIVFPAHSSVKDSGIPWIGRIPTHWNVENPKWMFFHRKARARKGEQQLAATQKYGVIPQDHFMEKESRRVTQVFLDFDILKHVERGDFVMSMRSFQGGLEFSDYTGCVSSAYVAIQPGDRVHSPFFKYLFKSSRYIEALQATSNLVRDGQALRFDNFTMVPLPVVPIVEQRAIAALLDEKCAKVDEAVRIKDEQIALLRERRQILVQLAVTRGLNPNASMKDSGIDWIGQVPSHWEVKRNFVLFREMKVSGNVDLPVLSVSIHNGVSSEELSDEENIRSIIKIEDRTAYMEVKVGDVAYNMMRAWQGGIGAVSVHGMVSPAYVVARPTAVLAADYFELLYRCPAFIRQMDSSSKGITDFRKRLYWDDFKNLMTLVPPRDEQAAIVQHIAEISKKIGDAVSIKEQQIATLREYKTSLIDATVTGKIKVG